MSFYECHWLVVFVNGRLNKAKHRLKKKYALPRHFCNQRLLGETVILTECVFKNVLSKNVISKNVLSRKSLFFSFLYDAPKYIVLTTEMPYQKWYREEPSGSTNNIWIHTILQYF